MGNGVLIVGPSKHFMSGITYYTMRLANALAEEHDVSVVCLRKLLPNFLFPGRSRIGHDISGLDFAPSIEVFDGVDYNSPGSWHKACSFIRKRDPSAIILQWWTSSVSHMLMLLAKAGRKSGGKIVMEMHEVADPIENDNSLLRLYSRLSGKMLFQSADAFVTHSNSDKSAVSSAYGVDERVISVIPHAVYDQYCNQTDQKTAKMALGLEGKFVLLSFGLVRKYKGIDYLIEAFSNLPTEIARESFLLIAGEIWDGRDSLTNATESSPYSDRIRLVDEYVSDTDVPTYFSASDVVCLPYLRASQSGVAHIGAAFGKPIIVSAVGGLKESMTCYEGTSFVPPRDSDAIASQIVRLFRLWKSGNEMDFPQLAWDWSSTVRSYEKML